MDRKTILTYVAMAVGLIVLIAIFASVNSPVTPMAPHVSFFLNSSSDQWNISVISVTIGGAMKVEKLSLTAMNSTGTVYLRSKNLSEMAPGCYYNGTRFVNQGDQGYLGTGDSFLLNRTVFKTGVKISLKLESFECGMFLHEYIPVHPPVVDSWYIENGTRHPHLWVNASATNTTVAEIRVLFWSNATGMVVVEKHYSFSTQKANLSVDLDLLALPSGKYEFSINVTDGKGYEGGPPLQHMTLS